MGTLNVNSLGFVLGGVGVHADFEFHAEVVAVVNQVTCEEVRSGTMLDDNRVLV